MAMTFFDGPDVNYDALLQLSFRYNEQNFMPAGKIKNVPEFMEDYIPEAIPFTFHPSNNFTEMLSVRFYPPDGIILVGITLR